MVDQSPAQASLTQKLETFAAGLTDEERQLLGRLLSPAVDTQPNSDEIQGYSFGLNTPSLYQTLGAESLGMGDTQIKLGLLRSGSVGVIAGRAIR